MWTPTLLTFYSLTLTLATSSSSTGSTASITSSAISTSASSATSSSLRMSKHLREHFSRHVCLCDDMSDGGFRVTCERDFSQTIEIRRDRVTDNDVTINCATPFHLDYGDENGTSLANYLTEKTVQKLVVKSCSFSKAALQDVIFDIVQQLEDLLHLTIHDVELHHTLPNDFVRGKRQLVHFELRNVKNQMNLTSNFFEENLNLISLKLIQTQLTDLPSQLLTNLVQLQTLQISENNLQTLPESFLTSSDKITSLNLSYNNLIQLPEDLLENLSQLTEIDLSGNSFETISKMIFERNSNLKVLLWNDDGCLASSQNRTFPENFLQKNDQIEKFVYSIAQEESCKHVSFLPNFFSNATAYLKNLSVTQTSLDWNDIFPILSYVNNIETLNLSYNKITKILQANFPETVTNLQLDGNHFDCRDCQSISFLIELLHKKDLVFYNSDNLRCKDSERSSSQDYYVTNGFTHFCEQEIYPYILGVNFIHILQSAFCTKV